MTDSAPELSVLIPTIRRREDLRRALLSVLKNGFAGTMEVIVSDDDPAGSAQEVVEAIGDSRVRHVMNPGPHGHVGNWAFLSTQPRGTYCFKLDDDDLIRPGFLSKSVEILRKQPKVGSVYTAYEQVDERDGSRTVELDTGFFAGRQIAPGPAYARAVLTNEGGYPRNHKTTAVYRRELAERFGHFRTLCEDFAFSIALAVEANVAYVPEPLYEYRLHGGNNITNLSSVSRRSFAALEALGQLSTIADSQQIQEEEWQGWLRRCADALPLYYLQAALRLHGPEEAQQLYIDLKMDGHLSHPYAAWTLVNVGGTLPKGLMRAAFAAYQRAPWLQGAARAFFSRGKK